MKKIFQLLCLIALFSFIYSGCRKENGQNEQLYTPYIDVINPPDSFIYYIPLNYNAILQGKIQFQNDAVWHITKTSGMNCNTWFSRADQTTIFGISYNDTVALQGNYPYYLSASNATSPDGVKIYFQFKKLNKDYQSFSRKF